jgi:hypothetical protein
MRWRRLTVQPVVAGSYSGDLVSGSRLTPVGSSGEENLDLIDVHHEGSRTHPSSKDPKDKKDALTVEVRTFKGTRALSVRFHHDETFTNHKARDGWKIR